MIKNNAAFFREACRYLIGGVNSPVRSFNAVGIDPRMIKKGRGAYLYDHDGKMYVDYVLSWGAAILGHAYPQVVRAIRRAAQNGTHFGATTQSEVELAKVICAAIPFAERVRFVNSGTEAVMAAVRLARGYSGRDYILKFEHSYHGHVDYLLVKGGSGLATLGIPASAGVPKSFVQQTLLAPWGDEAAVKAIFEKYRGRIAAVLVEPVGGNYGVIPPDRKFLRALRALTRSQGTLLIFDEVITGFRLHYGSAAQFLGVTPDLICLGKIIGGGLPVGAFGGREAVMRHLAPLGKVYQASTFAGNPVVMAAGLATLQELKKKKYSVLNQQASLLARRLEEAARETGQDFKVTQFASMFSFRFPSPGAFKKFFCGMLKQGVSFAPSAFEANFISFAHTEREFKKTVAAVRLFFKKGTSIKGKDVDDV